jgi:N-acetylneuraminate synthase
MPERIPSIVIGRRRIGPGEPCYVIAEMSANHHGSFERATAIVRAAKEAGADAVKLQTFLPGTMTDSSLDDRFRVPAVGSPWDGRRLYDLYAEAAMPWAWHAPLARLAGELGLDWFSTAYDESAVEFLEQRCVPAYKVASFEVVDVPLLRRIARTGKPVILSTGMATQAEIGEAVGALRRAGNQELGLLKCTSAYPAPAREMNLRTIPDLAATFAAPAGLSDHTLDVAVPVAAVTLGAAIIEKHLTLSRSDTGPDSAFSLEPDEFKAMVQAVRTAEQALGRIQYGPSAAEDLCRQGRRSLFVVDDVRAGEIVSAGHLRSIRPAAGLHPRHLDEVIGRRAARDIARGTPLTWDLLTAP